LAATRLALGDLHWKAGRLAEGVGLRQQGLAGLEECVRQFPEISGLTKQLADQEWKAAESYASAGLWVEAAALATRSLARSPDRPEWSHGYHLAAVLRLGRIDQARELLSDVSFTSDDGWKFLPTAALARFRAKEENEARGLLRQTEEQYRQIVGNLLAGTGEA